jgi:hypothetical protein
MKQILVSAILILFIATNSAFSQPNVSIKKIKEEKLIRILNDVEFLSSIKTDNLNIRVYKVGNSPGSAGFQNGEITHDLYIAVSGFDEFPKQNLFELGPYFNPKFVQWDTTKENVVIIIESGVASFRQKNEVQISINKIKIK